jgi:hypothetical protein
MGPHLCSCTQRRWRSANSSLNRTRIRNSARRQCYHRSRAGPRRLAQIRWAAKRPPSHSTIRNDADASDMSRLQRFNGRRRDHRPRKPSDANLAPGPRGTEAVDRNQNAWEATPAGGQLSVSHVRVPQNVCTAGLTNAIEKGRARLVQATVPGSRIEHPACPGRPTPRCTGLGAARCRVASALPFRVRLEAGEL